MRPSARAAITAWLDTHRSTLAHACRVTVAAVLSLAAAQAMHLTLPLWAVLTALVVTQISVGKSLTATLNYLTGTICGALYGTLIALGIPHTNEYALLAVLALAIAPLAILAAARPNFSIAPATAVIVILLPALTHASATASALDRVTEALVGGVVGLAVSFLGPKRAP